MPRRLFSPFHSLLTKKYKRKKASNPPETFPFLKLPYFAMKKLVNQMDVEDVVELTMLFSRFKRAVQTTRIEVSSLHFDIGNYYDRVHIHADSNNSMSLGPRFRKDEEEELGWKVGKLNGESVPICRTSGVYRPSSIKVKTGSDYATENQMEMIGRITEHLLTILNIKSITVTCIRKWEFENFFLWKLVPKVKVINIQPSLPANKIINSDMLSFEKILGNAYCKQLGIQLSVCPHEGINRMFKEWIAGKNPDLENIHFYIPYEMFEEAKNYELFLQDITTIESFYTSDKYHYKQRFKPYCLRSPLVDIKRETDGRLATVVIDKQCVSLYVWHEKHLNKHFEDLKRLRAEEPEYFS